MCFLSSLLLISLPSSLQRGSPRITRLEIRQAGVHAIQKGKKLCRTFDQGKPPPAEQFQLFCSE